MVLYNRQTGKTIKKVNKVFDNFDVVNGKVRFIIPREEYEEVSNRVINRLIRDYHVTKLEKYPTINQILIEDDSFDLFTEQTINRHINMLFNYPNTWIIMKDKNMYVKVIERLIYEHSRCKFTYDVFGLKIMIVDNDIEEKKQLKRQQMIECLDELIVNQQYEFI